MKLIHCADLHLDSKMTANLSTEQAKERRAEILNTFMRMVDYANDHDVELILIAGDLFDTRNVSATARNAVRDAIVMHPGITFLYLKGNHDNDNFLSKLDEIPANLKLFDENWKSYRYGRIVISGLELNAVNQATAYNSLVLDHDDYNIVMLHGQDSTYQTKDKTEVIALNEMKNRNIDYLALGHIHSYKEAPLDGRGIYCYPGCLDGRGFDECGEKGFVLLDIDEKAHSMVHRFVPFSSRVLHTVQVDVSRCMTSQEAAECIRKVIEQKQYPAKSMVKFVLSGAVDIESERNTEYLAQQFSDLFYFEKVEDETTLRLDYEQYAKDESLKGEFIRMVYASDLDEKMKPEVIRMGIQALSGEEFV